MTLTALPSPSLRLLPGEMLFDDRSPDARLGGRILRAPRQIIEAATPGGVLPALEQVEAASRQGYWTAGFLGFEAGYALEPRLADHRHLATGSTMPLLSFAVFERCEVLTPREMDQAILGSLQRGHRLGPLTPRSGQSTYMTVVTQAQELIAAGDIYQVNLTFPLDGVLKGDPLSLYAALRTRQPVAHGAVLRIGDATIVSISPELFVARAGQRLTARPMKGTIARGRTRELDLAAQSRLSASQKDRAENLMIVDLLRNDLSRVCLPGSVRVPQLFDLETYPTLHTLTSTIEGDLQKDAGLPLIMRALFPCGSVTGAPKIRAMEVISELEAGPRGPYTGALGWIAPNGDFSFNVAIRTLTVSAEGRMTYPVGAGIVSDSDPAGEYAECLLKAKVIMDEAAPFELIETLLWSPGDGFAYLTTHLDRLEASAQFFDFAFDRPAVQTAIQHAVETHANQTQGTTGPLRVRLTLDADGTTNITCSLLNQNAAPPFLRLCLADRTIDAADPYRRHKTTRRCVYDDALAAAKDAGFDEVLFSNQYGELTEGAWTNLFIDLGGDCLVTPPVASGLLPGVLRGDLIASGKAIEQALTLDDLRAAKAVFVGNSVRGLMPAALAITSTAPGKADPVPA